MMCDNLFDDNTVLMCNGCQHLKEYKFGYNHGTPKKNCFCEYSHANRILVASDIAPNADVPMPMVCPIKDKRILEAKQPSWEDITPLVKWEDIKKGDIYYIPPMGIGKPRYKLEVTYIGDSYFTGKILSPKSSITYTEYKSFNRLMDKELRLLVPALL